MGFFMPHTRSKNKPAPLESVFDETVTWFILLNPDPWIHICLYSCVPKWKVCLEHFCQIQKSHAHRRESTCAPVWVMSWPSCCFIGTYFLLEKNWQTIVFQPCVFDKHFSWKGMKWACLFKENTWQWLLPMIEFGFQVNISILESIYLPLELDSFLILQSFVDESCSDFFVCDFYSDFNIWWF